MEFSTFVLTERYERAFCFASELHRQQKRKNIPCPFMAHLLSVSALVCENIGFVCKEAEEAESYVMTAVLHDTIEDQGGQKTYDRLVETFGRQIADNVLMLSDSMPNDAAQKPPKAERNAFYLKKISQAPAGIVLISCCDKIHNLRTMCADALASSNLDEFWGAFSQKPKPTVENYRKLRNMYAEHLPIPRLIAIYDEVLLTVERLAENY